MKRAERNATRSLTPRGTPTGVRVHVLVPVVQVVASILREDEAMAIFHVCPTCRVKPYFACRGMNEQMMPAPHVARARLAAKARAGKR